ncbi:MAG: endonuclease/exonuclease/phosphatase family protein [Deltaproteobacteria bacterium]|uniref:endonuclease/exonuclease/phosphatase family protein n=1 Tax=Desulfobacula sp. TaxID=2593537 RepID=UPI0019A39FCD|nr:endonuclease/exonuclease/phosphatase family protein [Candidatus Desulfobacula maris]MBL6995389.1 endonuclease/exonuclease/phosphatase family protein [Desulfobacula sp.]
MKETYRFLLYNIRYGTGTGWRFHAPVPFSGYLRKTRKNIPGIIEFIKSQNPDLVGLIEVDGGSSRASGVSQAEQIADGLGHHSVFMTKYKKRVKPGRIPIISRQGNAFLAREKMLRQAYHYFERGVKRLIIEAEFNHIVFFIVHLSIRARRRKEQLKELEQLVMACDKPVVVGGDFNVFSGIHEFNDFLAGTGLKSANHLNLCTFPSNKPRWELDFIFHSPHITVNNMVVPRIKLSDHLPLICDFTIDM